MGLPARTPGAPPFREHPLITGLLYVSLAVVAVAPLIYGSYPQWISGFAVAVVCALGCVHIVFSLITQTRFFPVSRPVSVLTFLTLGWLGGMVARDMALGTAQGCLPSLSIRTLPYVFAFFAAGMLGASFGTPERFKTLLGVLTAVGFALAALAIVELTGWDVKNQKHSSGERPSGIFVSPNRLAVMLSLCASCGLALFFAAFKEPESGMIESRRRLVRQTALAVALAAIGGGIAFSLSRLTIVSFGVGLGIAAVIWTREALRREHGLRFRDMSMPDRIQRVALIALPALVVLAWCVWAAGIGARQLQERVNEFGGSESRSRFLAMHSALPLFNPGNAKLYGYGLGSFEAIYTAVQPTWLEGRWSRLHSDWMQLALEAGIPALVLALALTAAWAIDWWRHLRAVREKNDSETILLRLGPMVGVFTVLACTAADFPLRETGMALCFFFLAGASVRSNDTSPQPRWQIAAIGIPLLALLALSGWIAGRNALASSESPWFGQYLLPVDPGKDPVAWERSTTVDPDESQLHYFLALAADNAKDAPEGIRSMGVDHAKIAEALVPCDYRYPWVAGLLSEKLGKIDESAAFRDRAIELFPSNLALRLETGAFYLRRRVQTVAPGNSLREGGLKKALSYFHPAIRQDPSSAEKIAERMEDAGCSADEVAQLWEGDSPEECLARARYFADHDQWEAAMRSLNKVDPANLQTRKKELIWYHVLSGTIEYIRGHDDKAIAHWGEALSLGMVRLEEPAYRWMAKQARHLSPESAEKTASALVDKLKEAPMVVNMVGAQLHENGRDLAAIRLLEKTAGTTDYLCALWADTALSIGDIPTAEQQALYVKRYKSPGNNWHDWNEQFALRLERVKRDKKH